MTSPPNIITPNLSSGPLDVGYFRRTLGKFATGVTVITTTDAQGAAVGVTANSFNSVSLDPPLVLWSLTRTSRSLPAYQHRKLFAVHILAAHQAEISARFASRAPNKFDQISVKSHDFGVPILSEYCALFLCKTVHEQDAGDHVTFFGEVIHCEHTTHPPLIWHDGRYLEQLNSHGRPDDARSMWQLTHWVEGISFDMGP